MNSSGLFDKVKTAFQNRYRCAPSQAVRAPGRVNLIGEHTDYNLGYVLPVAIDREIVIAAAPTNDQHEHAEIYSMDYGQADSIDLVDPISKASNQPESHWSNYFRGVLSVWQNKVSPIPEFRAVLSGNIPQGAGLSSSAAFELAVACLLNDMTGAGLSPQELALLAHQAETDFVGVNCGIMDQFISALGQRDAALFLNCLTRESYLVPLKLEQEGLSLLVVESGVARNLKESRYNMRPQECAQALAQIAELLERTALTNLSALTKEDLLGCKDRLTPLLFKRALHVVEENARVLESIEAIQQNDFAKLGTLLNSSHASLTGNYEVSCPEVDLLVTLAQSHPEVLGARMTGAGFGGCIVVLLPTSALDSFEKRVVYRYQIETGKKAKLHACQISAGASILETSELQPFAVHTNQTIPVR